MATGGPNDPKDAILSSGTLPQKINRATANTFENLAPVAAPALVASPIPVLAGLGGGTLAGMGTQSLAKMAGASPDWAQVAGTAGNLAGGIGAGMGAGALSDMAANGDIAVPKFLGGKGTQANIVGEAGGIVPTSMSDISEWRNINETIGTRDSDFLVAQASAPEDVPINPGRGLAKAGISADQLKAMQPFTRQAVVQQALDTSNAKLNAAYQAADKDTLVDLQDEYYQTMQSIKSPKLRAKAIEDFQDLKESAGIDTMAEASPSEVRDLKQSLAPGAKFGETGRYASLADVRGKLYSALNRSLYDAAPQLKPLSTTVADQMAAAEAVNRQAIGWLRNAPPKLTDQLWQLIKPSIPGARVVDAAGKLSDMLKGQQ
jgi:hypothetical protein